MLDENGNNDAVWRYFHALAYKRGDLVEQAQNVFSLVTLDLGSFFFYNQSTVISPSATFCTISPCVRTYNSSIVNGTLRELEIKKLFMPPRVGNSTEGSYQLITTSIPDGKGWTDCMPQEVDGDGLVKVVVENVENTIPLNNTRIYESKFPPVYYPEECVWTYGMRSPSTIGAEAIRQLQNIQVASFPTAIYGDGIIRFKGVPEGTLVAKNLWQLGGSNFNTTDKFMSRFADTITARIRADGSNYATGQVHVNSTCIRVRWAWLSFLAITMAMTFCFLVALIFIHFYDGTTTPNWKSSSLAVLFCSVDHKMQPPLRAWQSRNDIFEVATATRAKLVRHDDNGTAKFVMMDEDRGRHES